MKMNKWCLRLLVVTLIVVNIIYWFIIKPSIDDHKQYKETTISESEEEKFPLYYDEAYGYALGINEGYNKPEYKYGHRVEPTVSIDTSNGIKNNTDAIDTAQYQYIGQYKITGYTPGCEHCCGNIEGITASGVEAIPGYTIATDTSIPFGTTLYIEGYGYYVVEDRGNFDSNVIDIAANNHDECYLLTNHGVNVYIVP